VIYRLIFYNGFYDIDITMLHYDIHFDDPLKKCVRTLGI